MIEKRFSCRLGSSARALLTAVCVLAIFGGAEGYCKHVENVTLADELWGKKLNTYVAEPTDPSGLSGDGIRGLKAVLERDLEARVNIDFVIVGQQEGADLMIQCEVTEFVWEGAPATSEGWSGEVIINEPTNAGKGRMQALFTVTDLLKKKVVWSRKVKATVSAGDQEERDKYTLLNERLSEMFIRDCFAKKKTRSAFPSREGDPVGLLALYKKLS